jgi:thiol-disulfide isomerase/thioredoxin
MVERIALATILIVLGVALWGLFNRYSIRRAAQFASADPLLAALPDGVPAILYFTTPFCEPCRTLQKPALVELQTELGSAIQVIQVDASEQPDVADRWGVFSAPTTFVLDRHHTPRQVNRGVTSAETLKKQLRQLQAIA